MGALFDFVGIVCLKIFEQQYITKEKKKKESTFGLSVGNLKKEKGFINMTLSFYQMDSKTSSSK